MILIDSWEACATTALLFFIAIFGRYVLASLLFGWVFTKSRTGLDTYPSVQTRPLKPGQQWREVGWSALTSLIFTAIAVGMMVAYQKGYTKIYTDIHAYGLLWYPVSIGVVLLIHETYYYWLHRWMHRPGVYAWVHKTHHESLTTSPWTAFSFHPLESTLQAILIPALTFLLPLHYSAVGLTLIIMTLSGAINHLNREIYPSGVRQWLIGATHHSLHHSQFRYNYGLYFTFWDKWMHTESPASHRTFNEKSPKKPAQNQPNSQSETASEKVYKEM